MTFPSLEQMRRDIFKYREWLEEQKKAPRTIGHKIDRLNQFIRIELGLEKRKGPVKRSDFEQWGYYDDDDDVEIYTDEQVTKFFNACNVVEHLLFSVYFESGFRAQEVANLTWPDVDFLLNKVQGANISSNFTGRHCKEVLDLDIGGTVLNFAHSSWRGIGFHVFGQLDAEALWCQITSSKGQVVSADLIVRSHLHYFMHVEHANRHAFLCPCWQLQTRFARHRSAYKLMPDVGALIFHISPEAKTRGLDPIAFTKLVYKLPTPRVNKFEVGKKLDRSGEA
jgi:hypothetical protein